MPTGSHDVMPASFSQRQLWFLHEINPKCCAYNISSVFRVTGALDEQSLGRAFVKLMRRHEVLRTRFSLEEGVPVQLIDVEPPAPATFCLFTDLADEPEHSRQEQVRHLLESEAARRFDLTRGPLVFCRLVRLASEQSLLVVTIHHSICDGWSVGILVRELKLLYQQEWTGIPATLSDLPIQFADYAAWQKDRAEQGAWETAARYWLEQLQGAQLLLELPSDRARPPVQSFRGGRLHFVLSAATSRALRDLCAQQRVTLFMALISAYATLLYRYTDCVDLLIGTPITNRPLKETQGLVGCFVNTLPIRFRFERGMSFRDLLKLTRQTTLDAFDFQDLPLELLIQKLGIVATASHNPLFQNLFLFQNNERPDASLPGVTIEETAGPGVSSRFDVSLVMSENGERIEGMWEYSSDLFEGSTIERISSHFHRLCQSICAASDQALMLLTYLTDQEVEQQLKWAETDSYYDRTGHVHGSFERRAHRHPDALAVVSGEISITYGELNRRADRIAAQLIDAGVSAGDLVGICAARTISWVAGLLGILKSGAGYVPLDPDYPPDRLQTILADAAARALLAQAQFLPLLASKSVATFTLEELVETNTCAVATDSVMPHPESTAYVVYTSGSTGVPKGVVITHGSLNNLVQWHQRAYDVTAADRATQIARIGFDASSWELWCYLTAGASIHLISEETRLSAAGSQRFFIDRRITQGFLPPVLSDELVVDKWPDHSALRVLLTGSDRIYARPHREASFAYVNHYGPTETTVISTAGIVEPLDEANGLPNIGRPISNTQILILDSELQRVSVLRSGELFIAGDGLARGYLGKPDLTAEKFLPNPYARRPGARMYKTGDVARFRPDGNIDFIGRNNNQVKLRGFRIELAEIEVTLCSLEGIQSAAVVVLGEGTNKRLVAYLIAAEHGVGADVLREGLRQRLPEFMVPSSFVYVTEFPLSPNGKVDRAALARRAMERAPVVRPPSDTLEELIATVWKEVLRLDAVSIDDNFFEVGGHSLAAVQLQELLESRLDRPIALVSIFRNPTIAAFATAIRSKSENTQHIEAARSRADKRRAAVASRQRVSRGASQPEVKS